MQVRLGSGHVRKGGSVQVNLGDVYKKLLNY